MHAAVAVHNATPKRPTSAPTLRRLGAARHGCRALRRITVRGCPQVLACEAVLLHVVWVLVINEHLLHHILHPHGAGALPEHLQAVIRGAEASPRVAISSQVPWTKHCCGEAGPSPGSPRLLLSLRVHDDRLRPMEYVIHPCPRTSWCPRTLAWLTGRALRRGVATKPRGPAADTAGRIGAELLRQCVGNVVCLLPRVIATWCVRTGPWCAGALRNGTRLEWHPIRAPWWPPTALVRLDCVH